MQYIADQLNISKNSVSQALSGKPGVSEDTRKRIEKAAEELGYHYTTNKKQSPRKRGNIALLASDFAFSQKGFFGEIYLSVQREVAKRGMNLVIQSIDDESRDRLILPSFFEYDTIDGVIIISHISTEYINRILSTGIPTVLIDHHHPFNCTDAILLNNRFAAYTATHHLIELGHKQIGFMGDVERSPSYQERLEGYTLALKEHGIPLERDHILADIKEREEDVSTALDKLKEQPTAWFCVNDGFGFLVLTHLQALGYKIPNDLSVCSFDNGPLSRLSKPKITTFNVDLELYGRKAVEQLYWRMDNPTEPLQETLLHTSLVKRESTGPAPARDTNKRKS
ncbi:LacI family DNA-binding transcriptional regulator [Bacillus sp. SD088]|nr:LacI family DNA-binding transcriptional regulator [Bacillus sp. SD088]